MANRRLGPSSGKCSKCGRRISINPPRPCAFCAGKRPVAQVKQERVFTESEVRAKDEDLKWAMTWMNNEAKHLRERGQPQEALEIAIDMVIERHGLHID